MADHAEPSKREPTAGSRGRGPSSGDLGHGPTSSRASVPPSEPRGSRASFAALDAQVDRPARLQMVVALILGLVLVAIPLYLWRRPRAESISVGPSGGVAGGALPAVTGGAAGPEEALALGDAKVLSCHDPGPKKTPPEQCDHVAELEKALATAIADSTSCVPRDAGGGTILFVADANFKKRTVTVSTPKEGRSLKSSKIAGGCERAVKSKLSSLPLESLKHEHARYRVAITATYPGPVKP